LVQSRACCYTGLIKTAFCSVGLSISGVEKQFLLPAINKKETFPAFIKIDFGIGSLLHLCAGDYLFVLVDRLIIICYTLVSANL
jgi:hypothetical protein